MAKAASLAGFSVHREFPQLPPEMHREILLHPESTVRAWWSHGSGKEELERLVKKFNFIGDGWISLLPFVDEKELLDFIDSMCTKELIHIQMIATVRDVESLVRSELQHWVKNDLERFAELSFDQRVDLDRLLKTRAEKHREKVDALAHRGRVRLLEIEKMEMWPRNLREITNGFDLDGMEWEVAFEQAGLQNRSAELPLEGVLLTFRLGSNPPFTAVDELLRELKRDKLSRLFVVLALDSDESSSADAERMREIIRAHCEICQVENPIRDKNEPFAICQVWDAMAVEAFRNNADWVVLLGDDIAFDCPFHYRATYRSFIDISKRLGCPVGFGCPWWNDVTFPGFPTFPIVGKAHFEIFGSLIPFSRRESFINQDLDPYLQRLYLKFGAAPLIEHAMLRNQAGGNNTNLPRYQPVNALGWRDWVLEDVEPLRAYLKEHAAQYDECVLVDVVVPTYRIDISYLRDICSLRVPLRFRTSFIVVVDNPTRLKHMMNKNDSSEAALALESQLVAHSKKSIMATQGNNIRVRCNRTNIGASATRNHGIDESAAEYILFLDDDVRPESDLLLQYEQELLENDPRNVGLVGMVRFPRCKDLSILHAGVLMSYLTFMFEIASNEMYTRPAWGVTANLLVKRLKVRFDTAYAKTGGGEDVDFCLRTSSESKGHFKSVEKAVVHHEFWPGGLRVLLPHFFHWAVGDGALFRRYPEHCYRSWPNIAESFVCFSGVWLLLSPFYGISFLAVIVELVLLFAADCLVEMSNRNDFDTRCRVLDPFTFSGCYYTASHILANLFVTVLEFGRFHGHLSRGEVLRNATRRFDWHCKRLPNAPERFRRRERDKFVWFLFVSAVNMILFSPDQMNWIKLLDSGKSNRPTSIDFLAARDIDL